VELRTVKTTTDYCDYCSAIAELAAADDDLMLCADCAHWCDGNITRPAVTYTLDAIVDGRHHSDYGLTAQQIANARANADRLGVTIIAIVEETAVQPGHLAPFTPGQVGI
jgi:hypothetical protein